ncbi:MAG: hypothetical protein SFZ23_02855 [Planctomycetota bacterium]|nr:hypothetical protein [Planctomycetota bacterium]
MLSDAASAQPASFRGVGFLDGSTLPYSQHGGVSPDGSIVVGYSSSPRTSIYEAFRWSAQTGGMRPLGDLAGGDFKSLALDSSRFGQVIVGAGEGQRLGVLRAARWTLATGLVELGPITGRLEDSSYAYAVSSSGAVIVGESISLNNIRQAFRWTEATGTQALDTSLACSARAVTAGGDLIAGEFDPSDVPGTDPFAGTWTQASGWTRLPALPGIRSSVANGLSSSGVVAVGSLASQDATIACRWIGNQVQPLGPGLRVSNATCVSADGRFVFGSTFSTANNETAFVWDRRRGLRLLRDALLIDHGINVGNWRLIAVRGASDDGSVITGEGINPQGRREVWVATVPVCPADLDLTGTVDLFDYFEYVQSYVGAGDSDADADFDGTVGLFDYLRFIEQFAADCP